MPRLPWTVPMIVGVSDDAVTMSFLDAAEAILRREGAPLHPDEIAQAALDAGLIRSHGATPGQTFKAKLSTEILKLREGSRFMRTSQNRFGLRAWGERFPEYIADRYQKALLDEQIVVFDRADLPLFVASPGLHRLTTSQSQDLVARTYSMQRREAEEDFSVVQLVSAFLVRRGPRLVTYKRTKRLPESRLHGFYSILFGGHLNPEDVPPLFGIFDPVMGPSFIQRELSEELRLPRLPEMSLVGVIYDDSVEVSTQHLGVLYEVFCDPQDEIEIGERGFLQQLAFELPQQIQARIDDFENWSAMVLRDFVLPRNAAS